MSVTSRIPNILATDFIEPVAIFKNVFYVSVVKKQTKAKRTHCYSVVRKKLCPILLLGILKFICITLYQIY